MCKHVAAVMYGVGARLDEQPEVLFVLRNADHGELIAQVGDLAVSRKGAGRKTIADEALGSVFGIEIDASVEARPRGANPRRGKVKGAGVRKGGRKSRASKR